MQNRCIFDCSQNGNIKPRTKDTMHFVHRNKQQEQKQQNYQALLTAKYCPRVAAELCTKKKTPK